eukprot:scaffold385_cov305-Pinguiococcus_pyrenoidosus.AAC.40
MAAASQAKQASAAGNARLVTPTKSFTSFPPSVSSVHPTTWNAHFPKRQRGSRWPSCEGLGPTAQPHHLDIPAGVLSHRFDPEQRFRGGKICRKVCRKGPKNTERRATKPFSAQSFDFLAYVSSLKRRVQRNRHFEE